MAAAEPPSWGAIVAHVDRTDCRPARDIDAELERAVYRASFHSGISDPLVRRRVAGVALLAALAAYRLAGGEPEHLDGLGQLAEHVALTGPRVGSVGDRARLARGRIELHRERAAAASDAAAYDDATARIADLERRAAALERPVSDWWSVVDEQRDRVRSHVDPGDDVAGPRP